MQNEECAANRIKALQNAKTKDALRNTTTDFSGGNMHFVELDLEAQILKYNLSDFDRDQT